jgi:hypothetical protein
MRHFFVVAVFVAAIFVAAPAGAAAPEVSPAAGSDAVLAARPGAGGELRVSYRRQGGKGAAQVVRIGLAADYHWVEAGGTRTIHDYRLRRIFTVGPAGGYTSNSLFAEVWLRGAELENRTRLIRGMAQAAGLDPATAPAAFDPFWIETDMGMAHPALARPELKRDGGEREMRWLLGGQQVASARFGDDPVPAAVRGGLRRLWPTLTRLHPAIADELAASGRLPASFSVKALVESEPARFEDRVWTMTASEWVEAPPYPLAAGLAAAPAETAGRFPELFATLADAEAERRLPAAEATYLDRAEAAITRKAGLEALLWLMELRLAAGTVVPCPPEAADRYCRAMRAAGPTAQGDPRTAIAFGNQPVSPADRARFADLPNAYLLGVLFASRPGGAMADNEGGLLAGLKASPVANFCKDTGDFYMRAWRPFAAWQAWDFGRLMAGHRADDLLGAIDGLEATMMQRAPMFF